MISGYPRHESTGIAFLTGLLLDQNDYDQSDNSHQDCDFSIQLFWLQTEKTIADPACGTGGFFLGAYEFISKHGELNKAQKEFLKFKTFYGNEYVANTRRLALMNMLLHGIGDIDAEPPIEPTDALIAPPKKAFDYVLTNPPFGKKSAITITNDEGKAEKEDFTYNRQDFWVTTSNKQLNFVQHVRSMLKTTGKAAIDCGAGQRAL